MIIGVGGKKGSGKNLFAKIFTRMNPEFKVVAFADPIKSFICDLFNLSNEDEYDDFKRSAIRYNNRLIDGRIIVREIGMLMIKIKPMILIDYVDLFCQKHRDVIITDVRRLDEIKMVQKYLDNHLVYINNQNIKSNDQHITENDVSAKDFNTCIENDSGLEDFKLKIRIWSQNIL